MITDKHLIDTINDALYREYRVLDGRPIYRIVWSDYQFEKRKGNYNEFYGHIFIRNYTAVKLIKKYWHYKTQCWVLEKLVFIRDHNELKQMQDELVESRNGSYEPVYSFITEKNGKEEALPVVWEVVEFILWKLHNPIGINPSLAKAAMEAEEAAEVKYFEQKLGEGERSPLFVWENSAFVSTNQIKYREAMTYKEASSPIVALGE